MTKNLILSLMLAICAFTTCRAEENVVYSGPAAVSGWNGVDLSAGVFADAGAGDVVRVYASGFLGADNSGTAGFRHFLMLPKIFDIKPLLLHAQGERWVVYAELRRGVHKY